MSDKPTMSADLSPQQKRLLLAQLLKERAAQPDPCYPLSHSQSALWFLHQLAPESGAYNVGFSARICSVVDVSALRRSLQMLLDRHASLRTTFSDPFGKPVQQVHAHQELAFEQIDATAWTSDELNKRVHHAYEQPFDFEHGPLVRVSLFSCSSSDHILLITVHHISCDGWSIWILLDELRVLYEAEQKGKPASLPPLALEFTDYVDWQARMLKSAEGERMWSYWQKQLAGTLPVLSLPTDRPRPPVQTYNGSAYYFRVNEKVTRSLKTLASNQGATLFMGLLAAYSLLLHRYTGQEDILVGSPTTGRSKAEFAGIVGDLINMVVFREDLSGNPTFLGLLERARQTILESLENQDYPFPLLVERLGVPRDPSYTPAFQSTFVLQKAQRIGELAEAFGSGKNDAGINMGGLVMERYPLVQQVGQFDLSLEMIEAGGSLIGKLSYNTDLFDAVTVERISEHLRSLLEGIVADPRRQIGSYDLLSSTERHQLLVDWNKTGSEYQRDRCIHELFELQVERTPESLAVVCGEQQLTYRELNRRANQLAHFLRTHGIGPERLVGICMERSLEMVIGLLGILKAGGAYLPMDPAYPKERLDFMLEETSAPVLLTQERLRALMPTQGTHVVCLDTEWDLTAHQSEENPAIEASSTSLAYVIYTSGSTGRPKGVMIEHRSLINLVTWHQREYGITSSDRATQLAGPAFDASVWELWPYLTAGASIHIPDEETRLSPAHLIQWLANEKITLTFLPTPLAESVLLLPWPRHSTLRVLLTGGDQLHWPPDRTLSFKLVNHYGPTENTVVTTWYPLGSDDKRGTAPPIGRPIANTRVYLLDQYGSPVPVGVPGELYVGGDGLARGYLNQPELTAERFMPDPFSTEPGARLYRTGDLVRYRVDGNIEFLGRSDQQVKIRGFRIELGEIETVLREHEGVADAAVVARGEKASDKRLIAYVVLQGKGEPSSGELRSFLKAKLPDYMVPSSFVRMDALPLTPNGKVDRRALPAPQRDRQSEEPFVAPRNETERRIAVIWRELLRIPQVGVTDSFFELGGNSLRAMEVLFRINESFNIQLPLSPFFENPTVEALASLLSRNSTAQPLQDDVASLQQSGSELQSLLSLAPEDRYEPFPLTDVQEAYWIGRGDSYELGRVSAHVYWEAEIDGLDIVRYEQTWQRLIERHEMLRAVILPDGRQQILKQTPPFRIKVQDLTGRSEESAQDALAAVRRELSHQILPSDQWPLFDIRASRLSSRRYRLHFSFDALIGDGWSLQVLQKEFNDLYGNLECHLTPLDLSFRDYVLAVSRFRESNTYQTSLAYWNDRAKTLPPRPELPTAKSPASIEEPDFSSRQGSLEPALWEALKRKVAALGLTENGLLLAAFADILATWSKQPRFLINLTLFNRFPIHPQVDDLVGDFTTLTLLEVDLNSDDTFQEFAKKLLGQLWKDLDHRFVSGVQVLRRLTHEQQDHRGAIAPVVFTSALSYRSREFYPCFLAGQGEIVYSMSQTPQVWLDHVVSVDETGRLIFSWFVVEDLFPPGMVDDMFQAYISHLRRLAVDEAAWAEPRHERAKKLIPERQLQQRKNVNATAQPISSELLHLLFEKRAKQNPEQTAVVYRDVRLSYSQLVQLSRRLGRQLRDLGVKPNSLVAIVMEKGWEQVVAALAILQSGAAYVPIDSNLPRERLFRLLENAQVDVALTQPWLDKTLDWPTAIRRVCVEDAELERNGFEALEPIQKPEDLAYVIYTSGSTGWPKGVMIDHRGAVNTILDMNQRFRVGPEDRVLAMSSLSFDLSVYDLFGVLAAGGTIVIPESSATRDPAHWADLMRQERVTLWNSVPALMEMLVEYVEGRAEVLPPSLRLVLLSGDWIPVTLPDKIKVLANDVQVMSLGGATEASIWSILYPIERVDPSWKSIPYGRPMVNQSFHVLNEALEPCPVWAAGQLYIGGVGLAKGYWRDEEKTREKFITYPRTGERFYCTGDLGRYLPSGDIEFLGREDFQVKIRGFRIELGEIEVAFRQHPGVRTALVTAVGKTTADRRLVAYVVPEREEKRNLTPEDHAIDQDGDQTGVEATLKAFLAERLPEHMIPSSFVMLDHLPLTSNGKVDYRSLPEPGVHDLSPKCAYVPPRDETERGLARVWQEVLHAQEIGIHDNFFELGGDSIKAIQLISRASKEGYQLSANQVFRYPTIAELAKLVTPAPLLGAGGAEAVPASLKDAPPREAVSFATTMTDFDFSQEDFDAIAKALEKSGGDV